MKKRLYFSVIFSAAFLVISILSPGLAKAAASTSPTVTFIPGTSGPTGCTFYAGISYAPSICTVPNEIPLGSFTVPEKGGSYVDANFGSTVNILSKSGVQSDHAYSTPSALSATGKYSLYVDATTGYIVDTKTGATIHSAVKSGAGWANGQDRWDAQNDDIMYVMPQTYNATLNKYVSTSIWRYSVSANTMTLIIDYTQAPYNFTRIATGYTGDLSADNWLAFWAEDQHQVCAVDLINVKTYCADYTATHPNDNISYTGTDIDFTLITRGVESDTGKRYVILVLDPSAAIFSVNTSTGNLDFEERGPEQPIGSGGNNNNICDPGEQCMGSTHSDVTQDAAGHQYWVRQFGDNSPCEADISYFQISKGLLMAQSVNVGGGRYDAVKISPCGIPQWPLDHIACAKSSVYCVIDFDSITAATPRRSNEPFDGEVMVIKGLGQEVRRIAEHRSVYWSYYDEPRTSISADGGYVLWDSNFGVQNINRVVAAATGYVLTDTTPPVLSSVSVSGVGQNSATISWTTDEAATTQVQYGTTASYGSSSSLTDGSGVTTHSVNLSGLAAGTTYHYSVQSSDLSNNLASSADLTFTTQSAITPPVISSVLSSVSNTTATITWNTNQSSNSKVCYGTSSGVYTTCTTITDSSPTVISHSVQLPGLITNSTYYYVVVSSTGLYATSTEQSFSSAVVTTQSGGSVKGNGGGTPPPSVSSSPSVSVNSSPAATVTNPVGTLNNTNVMTLASQVQQLQSLLVSLLSQAHAVGIQVNVPVNNIPSVPTSSVSNGISGTFTKSLWQGEVDPEVKDLQVYLNTHGYVVASSGTGSLGHETDSFGPLTADALAKFQKDHGISPASGYFGAITRDYISSH